MKYHGLYFLLIIATVLSACNSRDSTPKTTHDLPATATSLPATASPTRLSTWTATASHSPTATRTRVNTYTPRPTRTPTLTPSPTWTLPPYIRAYIQEPTAPCFWDICPGQTTQTEALNFFAPFGLYIDHTLTRGDKDFYYVDIILDSGLGIGTLLTMQDGMVNNLVVYIDPENQQAGVPREWLAYSPETLIKHYGTPSKVDFFVGLGEGISQYSVVLYFEVANLIIEYSSDKETYDETTDIFHLCPLTDQYSTIRLWLGKDPEYPPIEGLLLEKATAMTLEEFGELMLGDADDACVEIPHDVFP